MSCICNQKDGKLNEADRLALAALLVKAGYLVKLGRKKVNGSDKSIPSVQFVGDEDHKK